MDLGLGSGSDKTDQAIKRRELKSFRLVVTLLVVFLLLWTEVGFVQLEAFDSTLPRLKGAVVSHNNDKINDVHLHPGSSCLFYCPLLALHRQARGRKQ